VQRSTLVLHSDPRLMPKARSDWTSVNFILEEDLTSDCTDASTEEHDVKGVDMHTRSCVWLTVNCCVVCVWRHGSLAESSSFIQLDCTVSANALKNVSGRASEFARTYVPDSDGLDGRIRGHCGGHESMATIWMVSETASISVSAASLLFHRT